MNLYYRVTFLAILVLLGAIGLKLLMVTSSKKVEPVFNDEILQLSEIFVPLGFLPAFINNCNRYIGNFESVGRIASTAISFPLVLEYLLDQTITWLNPKLRESATLEDPLGHGLILCALLLSSHLPILLLGESGGFAKDLFFPLCRFLTVVGVIGKLHTFASDIWNEKICVAVIFYYLILQLVIINGYDYDSKQYITLSPLSLWLIIGFRTSGLFLIFYVSMKLRHVYDSNHQELGHHFFVTRKYLCTVLITGLVVYESSLLALSIAYLLDPAHYDIIIGISIFTFLLSVIILTVLPARVIRRAITAMEHNLSIQKETDQKNTFVRYVSHEIRSPLSTTSLGIDCLHNLLEIALQSQLRDLHIEELLDLTRDCRVSCAAAMHTLNDLLLFDKIENNMLKLEKKEIKCGEFLEDCIRPFVRQIAGLKFLVTVDPRLGQCTITCDVFKLAQVVRNLISNAVKFTPLDGSIVVNSTLVIVPKLTPQLRFEVTDTGAGISKENQGKIFQQYVQINATTLQGGKGSGLGLWICDAIIHMHDGIIGVSSRGEGHGSTFYFEIPVHYDPKETIEEVMAAEEEKVLVNRVSPLSDSQVIPGQEKYKKSSHTMLLKSEDIYHRQLSRSSSISSLGSQSKQSRSFSSEISSSENIVSMKVIDRPQGLNPPFSLNSSEVARKIKVLIADDSLLTRKMVEKVLRPFDMNIYHCNNGKDAVGKVLGSLSVKSPPSTPTTEDQTKHGDDYSRDSLSLSVNPSLLPSCTPFDVVIIDYMMPGLDGAEAIGKMREGGFKGFICAVTGSSSAEDCERLYNNGASIIMLKPFNVKAFYQHVKGKFPERFVGVTDALILVFFGEDLQ